MTNLGYLTDLFFLETDKEITTYPNYIVVKSPNEPYFYYGNFLLLKQMPENFKKAKLEKQFKSHFSDERIRHFTFCWSGKVKEHLSSFLQTGYTLQLISVLAASPTNFIRLKQKNEDLNIRSFSTKADWQQWIDLECEEKPNGFEATSYRQFMQGRAKLYQQLNQQKNGNFYGAYLDNELVAAAGLFHQQGIGRFQSVLTKAAYRRQGICKTLINYICHIAFQQLQQLVIAAEPSYHALDIYKSFGFREADFQTSVYWYNKE